jgi:hypothetical protein
MPKITNKKLIKTSQILNFFLRVTLYYYPLTFCFFGKIFLIASWKTFHKEHYRHSNSDANIFLKNGERKKENIEYRTRNVE